MATLEDARMPSLRDKQLAQAKVEVKEQPKEVKNKGRGKKQKEK